MIKSRLNIDATGNRRSAFFKAYKERGIDPKDTIIYEVTDDIPFSDIRLIGKEGKKKDNRKFLELPICLDTETSSYTLPDGSEIAWVYQWCLRVGYIFIGGRKPSELFVALMKIKEFYKLDKDNKAIIYIHNASYDWQFLKMALLDIFGEPEILATAPRHIIYAEYDGFIIRDSWILANRSLDKWGKDLDTKVKKVVGGIDYKKIVYQDDELSEEDWYYQLNDVEALFQCILATLKDGSDTLFTIPLTSTGFVRRDTRREYRKDKKNYWHIQKTKLDEITYIYTNMAYRGAYTHGNRFLKDRIIIHLVGHRDYRSFYPSVCYCDLFPAGKFQRDLTLDIDWIIKNHRKYACLCSITISNILINQGVTAPILSNDQIRKGQLEKGRIISDNGRVLKAEGKYNIVITELDLYWIMQQYNLDIELDDLYICRKKKLPEYLRVVTKDYFRKKTVYKQQLKDKHLSEDERFNLEQSLMNSKNKLNAIYGMCATNIVHDRHLFNFETMEWYDEDINIPEQLEKHYKSFNTFTEYQFGTWITANCRYRLLSLIAGNPYDKLEGIGYDKFIYADTDSIFYLKDEQTEKFFDYVNKKNLEERIKNDEYILDTKGNIVEFMTFEDEDDDIQKFKFLHSKCYGFYNSKEELTITIAGVTKFYREDLALPIEKRRTREDELGSLDNLKQDFKFVHCGGTQSAYYEHPVDLTYIDGHEIEYEGGCIIKDNHKTMNETENTLYKMERIYEIK